MSRANQSAPAFLARGLRKSFRVGFALARVEVLRGIDLELARGEFLGLVGPNGSGKSTLLRTIAGIDAPSGGELTVLGGDPDTSPVKRALGYLPEDSPFPRELKPLDALALLGSVYGMRRRFGLAAALLHQPDLILLDEPTAGLDALGFAIVDELLTEARARGASAVLASHLWTDLQRHCQRTALLIDGRVVASGSPLELVQSLGARTHLDVTLEGASERALAELRTQAEQSGARVVGVAPSQSNLLELYRRFDAGERA